MSTQWLGHAGYQWENCTFSIIIRSRTYCTGWISITLPIEHRMKEHFLFLVSACFITEPPSTLVTFPFGSVIALDHHACTQRWGTSFVTPTAIPRTLNIGEASGAFNSITEVLLQLYQLWMFPVVPDISDQRIFGLLPCPDLGIRRTPWIVYVVVPVHFGGSHRVAARDNEFQTIDHRIQQSCDNLEVEIWACLPSVVFIGQAFPVWIAVIGAQIYDSQALRISEWIQTCTSDSHASRQCQLMGVRDTIHPLQERGQQLISELWRRDAHAAPKAAMPNRSREVPGSGLNQKLCWYVQELDARALNGKWQAKQHDA